MIETFTIKLLAIFFLLLTAVLGWRLVRDKDMKKLSFASIGKSIKTYFLFLAPILCIYAAAKVLGLSFASWLDFALVTLGFIVPAVISSSGLSNLARSHLILFLTVAVSLVVGEGEFKLNFCSFLIGLVSWKAVDYLLISEESTMEDLLPSLLWITGIYWIKTVDPATWLPLHQKLLLGTLTVTIFLKWIQGPFLTNDKLYLKRISLAVTGALFLLIYITKLIYHWEFQTYALVAGVGFFLAYLFDAMDNSEEEKEPALLDFKKVLFVGIFTLLISRLFGMLGLLVMACAMLVSTTSGIALIAALFWISRVLAQAFIFDFNSNMTGINIMHTYAGAALFGGFFLVLALSLLIKKAENRTVKTILFMAATIMAPVTAIYFLHAEPTASLLYSSLVASSIIALMATSIYGEEGAKHQACLLLIPPQLVGFAVLTNQLIEKGNTAATQERAIALVAAFVVASAVLAGIHYLKKKELKEAGAEG